MSFKLRSSAFRTAVLAGAAIGAIAAQPAFAQAAGAPGNLITPEYNDTVNEQNVTINWPTFDPDNIQLPSVSVQGAKCSQQLDKISWGLDVGAAGVELVGLGVEIVAALDPSGVTEAASVLVQAGGFFTHAAALGLQAYPIFADLPDCNTNVVGGMQITEGGINVSGNSAFAGSVGVGGTLSVGGTPYAVNRPCHG